MDWQNPDPVLYQLSLHVYAKMPILHSSVNWTAITFMQLKLVKWVIQITKDLVQTNPLNKQLIVLLFWGAKSENQCVC